MAENNGLNNFEVEPLQVGGSRAIIMPPWWLKAMEAKGLDVREFFVTIDAVKDIMVVMPLNRKKGEVGVDD